MRASNGCPRRRGDVVIEVDAIIGDIFSTFQARVWDDGAVQSTEGEIPRRDGYVLPLAREGYGAVLFKECLQVGSVKGAVQLGLVAVMLWPEYEVLTMYLYAKVEAGRYVY